MNRGQFGRKPPTVSRQVDDRKFHVLLEEVYWLAHCEATAHLQVRQLESDNRTYDQGATGIGECFAIYSL